MDEPDERSETAFRHLVQRNGINWHCRTWIGEVVAAGRSDGELQTSAKKWLDDLEIGRSSKLVELTKDSDRSKVLETTFGHGPAVIQRALLLVGSPKTRKSTSNSLGGYLFQALSARSIHIETIYLHTVLRNAQKMKALLEAVDTADLITLAFPLYVDTLPAPVIEALERIALHCREREPSHRQFFSAIANCGFPEAYQTATALENCEIFARQAGFEWAGSLALVPE